MMRNNMRNYNQLEKLLELLANTEQYQQLQLQLEQEVRPLKLTPLQRHLKNISSYLAPVLTLPSHYRYSLEIEIVIQWLREFVEPYDGDVAKVLCKNLIINYPIRGESKRQFCELLAELHRRLNTPEFKAEKAKQVKESHRTYRVMCCYIDALFSIYSKLVVVRLDLSYQEKTPMSVERFEKDLHHLYHNTRHNQLFDHLVGHIIKIEFGLSKGLHAHVLLLFNGQKRKGSSHIHLARCIGEYWCKVIAENGLYWNVNNNSSVYEAQDLLGVGEIYASDAAKIDNLKQYVVGYLCRRKQFIKPKDRPKMKLLRRGDFPMIPEVKLGRPRRENAHTGSNLSVI